MKIEQNLLSLCEFYDIDVLSQSWERLCEYSFMTHSRQEHGLCYVKSGTILYTGKFGKFEAHSGDIVYLRQGSRYKARFVGFGEGKTTDILVNFKIRGGLSLSEGLCILSKQDIEAKGLFENILLQKKVGGICNVKAAFYEILSLLEKTSEEISADDAMCLAKSIIDNSDSIKNGDREIADRCKISISTLQRHFKKLFGITISDYRAEVKISRAKQYLLSGKYTVTEVSDMLGFFDSSYFCKYFTKKTGLSPKQFIRESAMF